MDEREYCIICGRRTWTVFDGEYMCDYCIYDLEECEE